MHSLIEKIVADMSSTTFLKDLTFAGQEFALPEGGTEELADVFVWLESDGLILQVKERAEDASHEEAAFRKWFDSKVVRKGIDQIAASASFFKQHPNMSVKNARGLEFELSELDSANMHRVVVFGTLANYPQQHHLPKFRDSKRAGFVHFIQAVDFTNVLHWARTPGEFLAYLQFREEHLREFEEAASRTERWMFGSFVDWSMSDEPPRLLEESEGEAILETLADDGGEVDLNRFLDDIGDWASQRSDNLKDFSKMMVECAHLTRSEFREFKRRIVKCYTRLEKPGPKSLYRIYNSARDCVFAFGVLTPHELEQAEIGATNYTYLLKHACRASKAVGFFFTPFSEHETGTTPIYLEMPWVEDPEAESLIKGLGPYVRPLEDRATTSYKRRTSAESDD